MNILIKFPSRGRPEKFKETFQSYLNRSSKKHDIKFICSFDQDDISMNNTEIKSYLDQYDFVQYFYGQSSNKIEAINANMQDAEFDILILAADDLFPCQDNYDDRIVSDMQTYHPDMDGCLHYSNPTWEERLDIGCIMGYKYYKRFDYIYHPSYKTIFCDNEYTMVAKKLNKHKYIPEQLFNHFYVISDITADRNWVFNREDEINFHNREKNNFYISD